MEEEKFVKAKNVRDEIGLLQTKLNDLLECKRIATVSLKQWYIDPNPTFKVSTYESGLFEGIEKMEQQILISARDSLIGLYKEEIAKLEKQFSEL